MRTSTEQPRFAPLAPPAGGPAPARAEYPNERVWRRIFRDGDRRLHDYRRMVGWLPSPPRCNVCRLPFDGIGGQLMRLRGRTPSHRNARYCNRCERVIRSRPGATDVELSIVFADVRGSTALAERAEHAGDRAAYVWRLRAFASAVKAEIERSDGFLIDVVGDEVVGIYPPGLSGPRHAAFALRAARTLVRLAGHRGADGTALPFGVGVHTGEVFLGNRFSEEEHPAEDELSKVRIIGDHVNVAARLASAAGAGEALVSEATIAAAGGEPPDAERRSISVAGRDEPVGVYVLRAE